jgi:hypothetical protein
MYGYMTNLMYDIDIIQILLHVGRRHVLPQAHHAGFHVSDSLHRSSTLCCPELLKV